MLRDVLCYGLRIVFCGTAVGNTSAAKGHYYGHPSNKFYDILYQTGLTPVKLNPQQYIDLLLYCIGLTDCVKNQSGNDRDIEFKASDWKDFERKLREFQPCILAFNGKKAAKECLRRREINYGLQQQVIGGTHVFVLPSTSAAAGRYWNPRWWFQMAEWAKANCSDCEPDEFKECYEWHKNQERARDGQMRMSGEERGQGRGDVHL